MDLKQLIYSICSIMSVSGHEDTNKGELTELVGKYFDEYKTDAVGNHLFIKRAAKANAPTLLIDTHFDEIGMLVTDIKEGGFLTVTSVGGLDPSILQASEVRIYGKETLTGIIASTPPHLKSGELAKKLKDVDELLIDTGYTKEELENIVRIGTPVGFAPIYRTLGNKDNIIAGKSFDNKACAAAAIYGISEVSTEELAANVCLLLSCHEETVRIGGIAPAAFNLKPDYAVVIDVNLASVPGAERSETVDMSEGISIAISAITDKKLTRLALELCEENSIKCQKCAAPSSTGTNTTCLSIVSDGIPVADIGLPIKNMHTYTEVLDLNDAKSLADFVKALVCSKKIAEVYANE